MDPNEVETIVRGARRRPLWEAGPATRSLDLGRAEIERILPHREPFLLLDRIVSVDLDQCAIRGERHIAQTDPILAGHFPEHPVYPGVLQLEIMGQLGMCLMHFASELAPVRARALKIHHAVFQTEVLPGDDIAVLARFLEGDEYTVVCAGQLIKHPQGATLPTVCAVAVSEAYLVDG